MMGMSHQCDLEGTKHLMTHQIMLRPRSRNRDNAIITTYTHTLTTTTDRPDLTSPYTFEAGNLLYSSGRGWKDIVSLLFEKACNNRASRVGSSPVKTTKLRISFSHSDTSIGGFSKTNHQSNLGNDATLHMFGLSSPKISVMFRSVSRKCHESQKFWLFLYVMIDIRAVSTSRGPRVGSYRDVRLVIDIH